MFLVRLRMTSSAACMLARHTQSEEERVATARAEVTRRIKSLGASGKVRDAISALAGLSSLGIQPDTRAATALVQACCRDMELAQSIFDELFGGFGGNGAGGQVHHHAHARVSCMRANWECVVPRASNEACA